MRNDVEVSVRKRAPWKPEKGELVRLWPFRLAIPEWAWFAIVAAVIVLVVILLLVL